MSSSTAGIAGTDDVGPVPPADRVIGVDSGAIGRQTTGHVGEQRGAEDAESPPLPRPSASEQLAWTSYLRVAAISAVVSIHAVALLVSLSQPGHRLAQWIATALDLGLVWCVPIFVMVSGALLLTPSPGQSAGAFYRRRLGKIAVPLVFWHVFYVFYLAVENDQHLTVKAALSRIYTMNLASPLYFFWLILGLYAITPVLRGFAASASARDLRLVTALVLAFNVGQQIVVNLAAAYHLQSPPAGNVFTPWLPNVGYFLLGHVLRDVVLNRAQRRWAAGLFVLLCAEFTWQYRYIADQPAGHRSSMSAYLAEVLPVGYDGPLVVVASVLLFLTARSALGPGTRWAAPRPAARIRGLGDLSLGVFGVHLAVIGVFSDRLLPDSSANWPGAPLSRTLVILAVGLVGSFAVTALLKRIPLVRRVV